MNEPKLSKRLTNKDLNKIELLAILRLAVKIIGAIAAVVLGNVLYWKFVKSILGCQDIVDRYGEDYRSKDAFLFVYINWSSRN